MPNRDVVADHARMIVRDMADAEILNVRVMTDNDAVDVAPQHAAKPDARLLADLHVADHPRIIGDEHTGTDLWPLAEVLQYVVHAADSGDARCKM